MECTALDLILASGRVAVLILGMAAGMLCVYLGSRLYRDGISSRASGEFSFKSVRVALTAASPGVFLALFGAYLMVTIVNRPLDLFDRQEVAPREQKVPSLFDQKIKATSDRSFLLKTQATASSPQTDPRCLIREKRRSLFSGARSLDATGADESLRAAIEVLEREMERTSDPARLAKYRKAVSALDELRNGIVR